VGRWFPDTEYDVVIEPDRITFAYGDARAEVAPRVSISDVGKLTGVGDEARRAPGRVVELFEPAQPDEPARFDTLVTFFRYVLALTMTGHLFRVRPTVRVRGVGALRGLMNGYEEQVVRDALLRAGAARVEFVGEASSGRR